MKDILKIILITISLAAISGVLPAHISSLANTPAKQEHARLIAQLQEDKHINIDQYHDLKKSEKDFLSELNFYTAQKLRVDYFINPALLILLSIIWYRVGKKLFVLTQRNRLIALVAIPIFIILFGYTYQPYVHTIIFWLGWYKTYKTR